MSQRGVARPQDEVILDVLAEFGFQGGLYIDFGEHAEALLCKRLAGAGDRIVKRGVQCGGQRNIHVTPCCLLSDQASARNNFSNSASVIGAAVPVAAVAVTHSFNPVATILNPARSRARDTAASWVTTSLQSRPCSIIESPRRVAPERVAA